MDARPDPTSSVMRSFADFVWGVAAVILTLRIASRHDDVSLYIALFVVIMWALNKMMADGLRGVLEKAVEAASRGQVTAVFEEPISEAVEKELECRGFFISALESSRNETLWSLSWIGDPR